MRKLPLTLSVAALALLSVPLVLFGAGQEQREVGGISQAVADAVLPPGWTLRAVRGERPPTTSIALFDGVPALVMRADSAAGQAWLEFDDSLDPENSIIAWTWRVALRPGGADLGQADRDDSPARFFVVFGGGGLFGKPRLLFYSWGEGEARDSSFLSHVSDRVGVVVVRNASDETGVWLEERRNLSEDFRRVFDREPDEVRAMGLMSDTDQLGGVAEIHLQQILLKSQRVAAAQDSGREPPN